MDLARYYAFKERSAKLPHVTVTREEFIRRLVERGESQEKAEQMATVAEGLGSLAIAALAYLVMSIDVLAYWVTVFPEVNLIVLGLIIALGRYTGFRLSEIGRFRQLASSAPKS